MFEDSILNIPRKVKQITLKDRKIDKERILAISQVLTSTNHQRTVHVYRDS